MYPNVFVTESFLNKFDVYHESLKQSSILDVDGTNEDKNQSLYRIRDLLLSSNIYTDLKVEELAKYHTMPEGSYQKMVDFIFHKIIKDVTYTENSRKLISNKQQKDCKESNFCYFTNNNFEDCENQTKMSGKIILGNDFLNYPFFLKQTFAAELTNEQIIQVEKIKHPCSSLIIIDKYLFEDTPKRQPKIPNLIHFLKHLIPAGLSIPFELDIFIKNPENNAKVESKFNQILAAFPNKLSLHIYAPKTVNHRDRCLITNYSVITIGHPFDDDQTSISCNFYPSNTNRQTIDAAYKTWLNNLTDANNLKNKTPEKYGYIKSIWPSDGKAHSIFSLV